MSQVACAAYWFNPLTWIAARRLRAERERACDDLVLEAGLRGADYAQHLLDIARTVTPRRSLSAAALAMARPSELEGGCWRFSMDIARGASSAARLSWRLAAASSRGRRAGGERAAGRARGAAASRRGARPWWSRRRRRQRRRPTPTPTPAHVTVRRRASAASVATSTSRHGEVPRDGGRVGADRAPSRAAWSVRWWRSEARGGRLSSDAVAGGVAEGVVGGMLAACPVDVPQTRRTLRRQANAPNDAEPHRRARSSPAVIAGLTEAMKDSDADVRKQAHAGAHAPWRAAGVRDAGRGAEGRGRRDARAGGVLARPDARQPGRRAVDRARSRTSSRTCGSRRRSGCRS